MVSRIGDLTGSFVMVKGRLRRHGRVTGRHRLLVVPVRWDGERARRLSTGTGDEREARRYLAAHIAGANTPAQPTIGAVLDHYLDDTHGHVAADDTLKYAAAALRSVLGDLQPRH
jgi:hypothetical protein